MSSPSSILAASWRNAALDLAIAFPLALGMAAGVQTLLDLSSVYPLAVMGIYTLVAFWILGSITAPLRGRGLGAANRVTLARVLLSLPVAGLAFAAAVPGPMARWTALLMGTAAIALDGVDGWIARRTGTESTFGARFDMETDAALILVLSILVWRTGQAGPWVLAIGGMRYLFVAAGAVLPALNGPLPESFRRKAVCVLQSASLLVALLPVVPPSAAAALCAISLASLAWSFGVDVAWLLRNAADHSALEAPTV